VHTKILAEKPKRKISPGRCQTVRTAQGFSVWTVHVAALAGWCGHGNELPVNDNAGNVRKNAETRVFKDLNIKWLSYLINHQIIKMYGEMVA
jgi:hypothetical protein